MGGFEPVRSISSGFTVRLKIVGLSWVVWGQTLTPKIHRDTWEVLESKVCSVHLCLPWLPPPPSPEKNLKNEPIWKREAGDESEAWSFAEHGLDYQVGTKKNTKMSWNLKSTRRERKGGEADPCGPRKAFAGAEQNGSVCGELNASRSAGRWERRVVPAPRAALKTTKNDRLSGETHKTQLWRR